MIISYEKITRILILKTLESQTGPKIGKILVLQDSVQNKISG